MKRIISLVALLCVALAGTAHGAERFTPAMRHEKCRYETWDGRGGFTDHETKLLIDCATDHFPVSGGDSKAFYIANRESGFECRAANPTSSARGVYQMVAGTWASWWNTHHTYFRNHGWRLKPHVLACRANVMIAIRSAHQWGWGPWGG